MVLVTQLGASSRIPKSSSFLPPATFLSIKFMCKKKKEKVLHLFYFVIITSYGFVYYVAIHIDLS